MSNGVTSQEPPLVHREKKAANLLKLIREMHDELHPAQRVQLQVQLDNTLDYDLGFDSLSRVELLARIEKHFGVSLPGRTLQEAETPRDLLRALQAATQTRTTWSADDLLEEDLGTAEPVPDQAQTLLEVLEWHVRHHPDRTHIRFYSDDGTGSSLSYRQLYDGAKQVAAGLQQSGVAPGQAVAMMLPTGGAYFYSFFAILMAGAIPVPLYPPARRSQLEDHLLRQARILENCRAVLLITVPEAVMLARLLKQQTQGLREVVTVETLQQRSGEFHSPRIGTHDIAFLQYTSGSTGDPKGVILTHANLLANIRADGLAIAADPNDIFVSWLPLYHDMGLIGAWLGSLYFAVLLVIMSPLDFLARPERWLWAIHRHRGTLSAAPNFAYELCLQRIKDKDIEGLDLSSWRLSFNGAESVNPNTVTGFCTRFAPFGFATTAMFPVYGLAESAVGLAFPPLGREPLIDRVERETFMLSGEAKPTTSTDAGLRFVACGQPLPGHEIRIVDSSDRELPERREGRLQFLGPSTTSGYFHNAKATAELFHGDWLDSGDQAYIAAGDVYITGRVKDVVIRAGRNIYPHELEEAVGDVPGIRRGRVAVFGDYDPVTGTEHLVVMAETRLLEQEQEPLRTAVNRIVTSLAGDPPEQVVLTPPGTILKTSSGKIRRAASHELYRTGHIRSKPAALWHQIARLALKALIKKGSRAFIATAEWTYAGYAWSLFLVAAILGWPLAMLLPTFQMRWNILGSISRVLFKMAGIQLQVTGKEKLDEPRRSCVIVANHASLLDAYVMVSILPVATSFLAKSEVREHFFGRLFMKRMEAEYVDRFDRLDSIESAKRARERLARGNPLLFFAEGTTSRTPGLLPFHMGAFVTSVKTGAPLVPVAISGTRSILRSGSWFPRRGSVRVVIGDVILPDQQLETWEAAKQLRDVCRNFILAYSREPDLGYQRSSLRNNLPK